MPELQAMVGMTTTVGGVSAQDGHVRHGPARPRLAHAYQPLRRVYSLSSPSLTGRFIASSRVCSTKCNTAILSKACLLWLAGGRQVAAVGLAPRASLSGGEMKPLFPLDTITLRWPSLLKRVGHCKLKSVLRKIQHSHFMWGTFIMGCGDYNSLK